MNSLKFPEMFSGNMSRVYTAREYGEATKQNVKLLLSSERNGTLGDPYIGLSKLLFDQNSYIMQDAVADTIYTQIALFMPQIKVRREDIKIVRSKQKGKVICTFTGINQLDFSVNTYNLTLFNEDGTKGI